MADTRQLSNPELGARLGISASYASYLRNGQRQPGAVTLQAIAREFNVDYETLVSAMVEAENGNPDPWVILINTLTKVPT